MVLTSSSHQPLIILPDMKADFLLLLPKLETALGMSRWPEMPEPSPGLPTAPQGLLTWEPFSSL